MWWLLLSLLPQAHAQACVCSRNVALPTGNMSRPWEGVISAEYNLALSSDPEAWNGFYVKDLHGDSMAGMYMPPHRIQTASLTPSLGLPRQLAVSVTLPWLDVHHLAPSEMAGDVDERSIGDVDAQLRWNHVARDQSWFAGVSGGPTFPTGEVVEYTPTRAGRGAFGLTGMAQAGRKLAPRVGLATSLAGTTGLGADSTGYTVAPNASATAGARFSPRENGRFNVAAFTLLRWQGRDRQDALTYQNTGYVSHDLSLGVSWNAWARGLRSATLTGRAVVPLWQVVGDPMYAENFALGAGLSVVAF